MSYCAWLRTMRLLGEQRRCSGKLGRLEEAFEADEQALELDPDNATYRVDKGVALARLG